LQQRLLSAAARLDRWPGGIPAGWQGKRKPLSYNERKARREARQGLSGFNPVMPGFEVGSVTTLLDNAGNTVRQTVRQKPAAEHDFDPGDRRVGKVTSQVSADGRVEREWIRTAPDNSPEAVIDAAKVAFEAYRGFARLPAPPSQSDADTLTIYPLADLHIGMFAWGKETGEDYDLVTAVEMIRKTFGELIHRSPNSRRCVILGLGDLLHADNSENRTMRSGHVLDVDTRYQKVLTAAALLIRQLIEMAAAKHEIVEVRVLPGNHDEHSAVALAVAMSAFFDGRERVAVDMDPSPYWFARFGVNLLGAHHGHLAKPIKAPGIMASHCAIDWGATTYRHMFFGHFHHARHGGEDSGMTWEVMQTPAPRDAYNAGQGYWAGRSMGSRTFHAADGPIGRVQVNIRPSIRTARDLAA